MWVSEILAPLFRDAGVRGAGQLDVRINLTPNDDTVTRLELVIIENGEESVVAAQEFAAGAFAQDEATEITQEIVLSFNTARYELIEQAGVGVPDFLNGNKQLSARVFSVQAGAAPTATNTFYRDEDEDDGDKIVIDPFQGQVIASAILFAYADGSTPTFSAGFGIEGLSLSETTRFDIQGPTLAKLAAALRSQQWVGIDWAFRSGNTAFGQAAADTVTLPVDGGIGATGNRVSFYVATDLGDEDTSAPATCATPRTVRITPQLQYTELDSTDVENIFSSVDVIFQDPTDFSIWRKVSTSAGGSVDTTSGVVLYGGVTITIPNDIAPGTILNFRAIGRASGSDNAGLGYLSNGVVGGVEVEVAPPARSHQDRGRPGEGHPGPSRPLHPRV